MTNLYNRAIIYGNMDSFDRSYGQVTGNYRNGANYIDNLNWPSILNGEINLGDLEKETLPIYIERYTVDSTSGTAAEREKKDIPMMKYAFLKNCYTVMRI